MLWCLRAAGLYNIAWGAWAVLFPTHFWRLLDMEQPNYIFLWQCIGMIVGVYGVGYWVAARDVARHWPIVLVGLLGKIFGPLGFIDAHFVRDLVPLRFGVTLLTNDLVWWVPFGAMLWHAYRVNNARYDALRMRESLVLDAHTQEAADAMRSAQTSAGESLAAMSERGPVLVVFLRHLGCTFCREAMADLARVKPELDRAGVRIALVHMSSDDAAKKFASAYGLSDAVRVSDPQKKLYNAFALARGNLEQLFGPRLLMRGFDAGVLGKHGVGTLQGDGLQLGGAFVVQHGRVVRAFRHRDAGDRPDYCSLAAV
jgi:peroxiredoxin